MNRTQSESVFKRAKDLMPGGVNSPVRAFGSVGGTPVVMESGAGAMLRDVDGNRYLDFVSSWGPLLFGHAHPVIVEAVRDAAGRGTSFGAPTRGENELAERIMAMVPSMERVRLTSSGTEAAMSAVRLARGCTGRDPIIKFTGCYHGHGDSFLIKAGSGALTFGRPGSPGVTAATAGDTLLAAYNDAAAVEALFKAHPDRIAAVIVEPVAGNMGVVPPAKGFLQALRELTTRHGALLIFDEVITGFRLGAGGAQALYGVKPDLTVLGKIIGGGLPVAAYGGRRDLMARLSPDGPVYQAGTLSGNPLAVAAGIAMLELIRRTPGLYGDLEAKAAKLESGLLKQAAADKIPAVINRVGSMLTLFFTSGPVRNLDEVMAADSKRYGSWFHGHLSRGVYLAPSAFEAAFISAAMTDADIDRALQVSAEVFAELPR